MLILHSETDFVFVLFYSSIVQASPTDELEERLQQMTLPDPSLWGSGGVYTRDILYHYPHVIDYLRNSVRSLQYEQYL